MTFSSFLAAAQKQLQELLSGNVLARGAWCRKQRRQLRTPGRTVVWIRGAPLPWAVWGARRGYFAIEYMNGVPYLSAVAAAPAA